MIVQRSLSRPLDGQEGFFTSVILAHYRTTIAVILVLRMRSMVVIVHASLHRTRLMLVGAFFLSLISEMFLGSTLVFHEDKHRETLSRLWSVGQTCCIL